MSLVGLGFADEGQVLAAVDVVPPVAAAGHGADAGAVRQASDGGLRVREPIGVREVLRPGGPGERGDAIGARCPEANVIVDCVYSCFTIVT